MIVYESAPRNGYEWVNTLAPDAYEVFSSLNGSPRAREWTPVQVRRVSATSRDGSFLPSDFPWLGSHVLIMRERAARALRPVFEPHAELLPLVGNDGLELFALNVTTVLDALDEERSSIQRFADTKTIMRIKKTVFRPTVVRDVDVFWLPHRASATYLSQRFVDAYAAAGLVGLEFRKVWSEAG